MTTATRNVIAKAARGKPVSRATLLAETSVLLQRIEAWAVANKADYLHKPAEATRLRSVAFTRVRDLICRALNGDTAGMSEKAADAWIDAALGAGVSIERRCTHDAATDVTSVGYVLHYTSATGAYAVADAFIRARAYGPDTMNAALEARFTGRESVAVHALARDMRGELMPGPTSLVLRATNDELRAARLACRADRYAGLVCGG